MLRAGTTVLSILLLGVVIWLLRAFYSQTPATGETVNAPETGPTVPVPGIEDVPAQAEMAFGEIHSRLADVTPSLPSAAGSDQIYSAGRG